MRIAFLIGAHTDVKQLIRLLESLQSYGDAYIHVDGKVKDQFFLSTLTDYVTNHSNNVFVSSKRFKVAWGGYSQVKWQILLLKTALSKGLYDRYVFLSGLDYPIYSVHEMMDTFEKNKNKEYVNGYNLTLNIGNVTQQRIKYYHFFRDIPLPHKWILRRVIIGGVFLLLRYLGIRCNTFLIVNNEKWNVYVGSQWTALTKECAKYIVKIIEEEKCISKYFSHTYSPDELVIPTIVFNSEFCNNAVEITQKIFSELAPLHYLNYTDHIWDYDEKDYYTLVESKKMFVRKLISGKSEKLIEMLEKRKKTVNLME